MLILSRLLKGCSLLFHYVQISHHCSLFLDVSTKTVAYDDFFSPIVYIVDERDLYLTESESTEMN